MDFVKLSRAQLKQLAKENRDVVIQMTHPGEEMVYVCTEKHWGESNEDSKWLQKDGHYRGDGDAD